MIQAQSARFSPLKLFISIKPHALLLSLGSIFKDPRTLNSSVTQISHSKTWKRVYCSGSYTACISKHLSSYVNPELIASAFCVAKPPERAHGMGFAGMRRLCAAASYDLLPVITPVEKRYSSKRRKMPWLLQAMLYRVAVKELNLSYHIMDIQ